MPVQVVRDIEVDEVSLVDRPANQHSLVVIAKRANQEDTVADEYFGADGQPVEFDETGTPIGFQPGDILQDADGNQFQVTDEDKAPDGAEDETRELATVGKSAFFSEAAPTRRARTAAPAAAVLSKSLLDGLREEINKAVSDEDRDNAIQKAFGTLTETVSKQQEQLNEAVEIAKAERTTRLTREYISKAAEYNVPIPAEELGPVLMHAAELLPYEDCAVIHKALTAAGSMLFEEVGYDGGATNGDPLSELEAELDAEVAKGANGETREMAMTHFFDDNPAAYAQYRAEMKG